MNWYHYLISPYSRSTIYKRKCVFKKNSFSQNEYFERWWSQGYISKYFRIYESFVGFQFKLDAQCESHQHQEAALAVLYVNTGACFPEEEIV